MKHTSFIATVVVSAIALTAGSAWAERAGGKHHGQASFETLDTDGNGEISQEEFANRHQARFDGADQDSDGNLSREEMIAASLKRIETRVDKMIERLDANKDGVLSQDEMEKTRKSKHADKFFDRIDQDDNGSVSKSEFEEAQTHMGKHGKGKKHKN